MEKKEYSKEDVGKLIKLAHKNISRVKGKDYSPDVHELQKWIDDHLKKDEISETNKLKGGLSDKKTLVQIAKKHSYNDSTDSVSPEKITKMKMFLSKQLEKGIKVEMEHTKDKSKAKEIAMDHLYEDPKYYTKLKKIETKESMGADAAGSSEPALGAPMIKRKIGNINNSKEYGDKQEFNEALDSSVSSSASFDVPLFGTTTRGRKNPLAIGGPETIKKSRAVKDKNFPKWGGPGGIFIKIKDKCKKFPYCNQGDINALEILKEAIDETSKKYGIPVNEIENIVLNEIKKIFI
jgi:hypothetical protein